MLDRRLRDAVTQALHVGLYDVIYHAFEVCGRRYVPRPGVGAGSGPGVSSAGGGGNGKYRRRLNFLCVRTHRSDPSPLPVTKCHTGQTLSPPPPSVT